LDAAASISERRAYLNRENVKTMPTDLALSPTLKPRNGLRTAAALAGLAAAVTVGGCSGAQALNAIQRGAGLSETLGVAYGADPRHRLDVYAPAAPRPNAPVVVFFYGGNWNSGEREDYRFVGRSLAEDGAIVVIPDYRVYPQVRWPDFLRDSAQAVRWARDNAVRMGGDADRLFLMGHSAGAYNAVKLATDGRWLGETGLGKSDLRGVVGLAGPYDFLPVRTDELRAIFGPEAQRPDTQPINHIDGSEPPMLLMTGAADRIVDPGNTTRMAGRLRGAGSSVEAEIFPHLGHAMMAGALSPALRFTAPVFARASAFIHARPAPAGAPS